MLQTSCPPMIIQLTILSIESGVISAQGFSFRRASITFRILLCLICVHPDSATSIALLKDCDIMILLLQLSGSNKPCSSCPYDCLLPLAEVVLADFRWAHILFIQGLSGLHHCSYSLSCISKYFRERFNRTLCDLAGQENLTTDFA